MTLGQKIGSLKAKRANILGRAKKASFELEKEFVDKAGKRPSMKLIKSYTGKYNAIVGPLLKEAREIETAIELLS